MCICVCVRAEIFQLIVMDVSGQMTQGPTDRDLPAAARQPADRVASVVNPDNLMSGKGNRSVAMLRPYVKTPNMPDRIAAHRCVTSTVPASARTCVSCVGRQV